MLFHSVSGSVIVLSVRRCAITPKHKRIETDGRRKAGKNLLLLLPIDCTKSDFDSDCDREMMTLNSVVLPGGCQPADTKVYILVIPFHIPDTTLGWT